MWYLRRGEVVRGAVRSSRLPASQTRGVERQAGTRTLIWRLSRAGDTGDRESKIDLVWGRETRV